MKVKTETVFAVLNVLVWIVFIGLLFETAAILVSYLVCLLKPEAARNMNQSFSFLKLRYSSLPTFSIEVFLLLAIAGLKSFTAYLILKIFNKLKLSNPFEFNIARLMESVSYFIFAIWILSVVATMCKELIVDHIFQLRVSAVSFESLFLAGIIFIFARIFKKGVEIQSENELTV